MSKRKSKVLIVATSHKTRGGITSVVMAHKQGVQWSEYNCKWIEAHIDRGSIYKLYYFFKSFISYLFVLPGYDLVHIHTSEPPSAIRKIPFMFWAKIWKKKIIVHFHAFSPDTTIKSKYDYLYKYLFSNATKVLLLSEYWRKEINNTFHIDGEKISILYNPCRIPIGSSTYVKKNQILYAGTITDRKGYTDLIMAFALIAQKYPQWKIVLAGNGDIDKGKSLALKLGIEPQIQFLGWVDGEAKTKVFKESTIFCLPSYAEGFPMAVLDAWACGLAVITTPVGGLSDILINEKNALVFTPGDIKGLAVQLSKIIENEMLRISIEKESVELARSVFDLEVICKRLANIYKSLLDN